MEEEHKACRKCQSTHTVKNGTHGNVQRFKCKDCGAVFRGNEPKYSASFKLEVVMMHLNSVGFRAIGRLKGIHNSLVSYWVKQAGVIAKESFQQELEKVQANDIQILEVDELFTYIKKKPTERIY